MLTFTHDTPFFTGGVASADTVPALYDCALNGRPYMIDLAWNNYGTQFAHATIPLIRNQADQASSPSEASINPDDLWRRSQDTWHDGSGQSFYDRTDSDPARFYTSKGVDVWTKWQLSLLNSTSQSLSSLNTNLQLVAIGDYLYVSDGTTLKFTTDLVTWTTVGFDAADGSGASYGAGSQILSIATDGHRVYIALESSIYVTVRGDATATYYYGLGLTSLGYAKNRLMGAVNNVVYNVTLTGSPIALLTHDNPNFQWIGFAEGESVLYAAGYSGDKSLLYRFALVSDATGMGAPTVAGRLPDGEIVSAIYGYLGFLLIGSNKGVRLATSDASGHLTIHALIPTTATVRCFEGQDRFVWYGLTDYDTSSTGLGRIDLSAILDTGAPAYASDLMVTGQGIVSSTVSFLERRVVAVGGLGVYVEVADTPVSSGTLETGQISYRLPDDKVAMFLDVRHDGLGSHTVELSVDDGPYRVLGTHTDTSAPFEIGGTRGFRFGIRLTLTAVAGVSPIVRSLTLRSYPTSTTVRQITVPLLLHETLELHNTDKAACNPIVELDAVDAIRESRNVVTWQEGATAYDVIVDDYEWRPYSPMDGWRGWNGTLVAKLKVMN